MFMHTYNNPVDNINTVKNTAQWLVVCYSECTEPELYIRLNQKYWGKIYASNVEHLLLKIDSVDITNKIARVKTHKHSYLVYDTNKLPENIAQIILDCNNKVYYS